MPDYVSKYDKQERTAKVILFGCIVVMMLILAYVVYTIFQYDMGNCLAEGHTETECRALLAR